MQDFAKNYIKSYEGLGRWVKFLLNFLWAIPTNLYRLSKSIVKKDTIGAVLSIILQSQQFVNRQVAQKFKCEFSRKMII